MRKILIILTISLGLIACGEEDKSEPVYRYLVLLSNNTTPLSIFKVGNVITYRNSIEFRKGGYLHEWNGKYMVGIGPNFLEIVKDTFCNSEEYISFCQKVEAFLNE